MKVEEVEWFELLRHPPPGELDMNGLRGQLALFAGQGLEAGDRVALAVGSRGIDRVGEVVALAVEVLRARGVSSRQWPGAA